MRMIGEKHGVHLSMRKFIRPLRGGSAPYHVIRKQGGGTPLPKLQPQFGKILLHRVCAQRLPYATLEKDLYESKPSLIQSLSS